MKLAILSRSPSAYSTHRLKSAALERGHDCKVLNTLRFAVDLSTGEPDLQFRGKHISDYDAVLPRIGASITYFGTAVVRQFEQMDVYTPNTANGIANSRDKLRAAQILSRHDIGMPATSFVRDKADVLPAIDLVGGAPVVIKLLEGTQGIGVILAPDKKVAEAIIETLQSTKQNVLIQQFIAESRGRDIRALVVGDRVVGPCAAAPRATSSARTCIAAGRSSRSSCRPSTSRPRYAPRRSWGCGWPASTCSRATTGRWSWRSTRRPGSRASSGRPNSTSPARSSTTSRIKSRSPNSTSASG